MIRIDYRKGSGEFVTPLARMGLPVKKTTLPFGDFKFTGYGPQDALKTVVVERKRFHEIITAIQDNRYGGFQLPGMLTTYPNGVIYLLVEGIWRADPATGIVQTPRREKGKTRWIDAGFTRRRFMFADFDGFLTTVEQFGNVHVVYTSSERHSQFWLCSRYRWWQKPWNKHTSLRPFFKRLHSRRRDPTKDDEPEAVRLSRATVQRKMVAQIDGVLWDRSRTLEQAFGLGPRVGIDPLWHASLKDLLKVDGIGPVLAGNIYQTLHGRV